MDHFLHLSKGLGAKDTGNLCHWACKGVPCLSEAHAFTVFSLMDTLGKQSKAVSSIWEVAQNTNISVFSIVCEVLRLYSYMWQSLQQLLPNDRVKQQKITDWALSKLKEDPRWFFNILWRDKAHFSLYGTGNVHNQTKESPHAYTLRSLYIHYVLLLNVRCIHFCEPLFLRRTLRKSRLVDMPS